ncbi:calcium-binding protein [Coleofasciculus sp. G2-EDA-02]|uniref:calcium-binding protein n=1 Tax=Coleofasciculus sp. G2-EDA-02 TaxID=3069529 RepID=UPI0032FA860F
MSSPINDKFADSIRLVGSDFSTTGTNIGATGESGEPYHGSVPDTSVWWNWRAPADGVVTINTVGSNFDTALGIHTGSAVDSLNTVVYNDDFWGLQSQVSFTVEAGQTYNIAVDGFGASQGSVNLNLDLDFDYTQLGTNASEQLNGTQANDVIAGLAGNDQINGNGGHDYLEGNAGNDTIAGGSLSDYLDGGAGDDLLFGNGGGDEILGGGGNDGLYGSSDADYLDGGAGNDVLYGNGGQDYLLGGGGADTIYGGAQADEILGGDGNDLIYSNGGDDLINGGNGIDEIWLGGGETVVLDANDTGYDIIRNFQLGQTTLAVNDISNLSFADGANGAEIYQGGNLLATVSWQSASTFANNMNNIFVAA